MKGGAEREGKGHDDPRGGRPEPYSSPRNVTGWGAREGPGKVGGQSVANGEVDRGRKGAVTQGKGALSLIQAQGA